LGAKEVEALGADRLHERPAAAGQDDHAIIGIGADRVKKIDKLFVGMPVEDKCAAIGVKRNFQNAALRTDLAGIGETVAIGIKTNHGFAPCR